MIDGLILLTCLAGLVVDIGIWYYVKQEYLESKELNMRLGKIYRSKKKKLNADRLVKAVIAQEAPNVQEA